MLCNALCFDRIGIDEIPCHIPELIPYEAEIDIHCQATEYEIRHNDLIIISIISVSPHSESFHMTESHETNPLHSPIPPAFKYICYLGNS